MSIGVSPAAGAARRALGALVGVSLLVVLSGCGASNDDAGPPDGLSAAGAAGWAIADERGCMSCHGPNGAGGTGPGWIGLAGSQRELADGTVVTADRDYLIRALVEPDAEVVAGFALRMPTVPLSDDDVIAIVEYLEEVS